LPPADYITERAGTAKWVVAHHLNDRLRRRGYEKAVHPKMYNRWVDEWRAEQGAPDALTDPARARVIETACARNRALMAANWRNVHVPACESNRGVEDRVARRAYLAAVPHSYTRTGRSFVLQAANPGHIPGWLPYWIAVVDAKQLPRRYRSRAGALAAARKREAAE
jgi:hypothetical protein